MQTLFKLVRSLRQTAFFLLAGLVCAWAWCAPAAIAADFTVAPDADLDRGATVFEANCAGCHINGGNIMRWGKTLKTRALKRNQADTTAAIEDLVTNGKGIMSAYGDRLSAAEIHDVSAYVLDRANADWK